MYLAHFGIRELPFSITPDLAFAYESRAHLEALNTLLVAQANGEGFVKVVGEVGSGKTLLCRRFIAALNPEETVVAHIPNPSLSPRTLMLAIASELGLQVSARASEYKLREYLHEALLSHAKAGRQVVICVDEAQALPLSSLEAVRLLSNLETSKRKLMQLVLFGQPELDIKLGDHSVRQIRQRIGFSCRLSGLNGNEIHQYLHHRMQVAGYHGAPVFDRNAIAQWTRSSGGIPRLINILANKGLMLAYGHGTVRVGWREAWQAISDTQEAYAPQWLRRTGAGKLGAVSWALASRFAPANRR